MVARWHLAKAISSYKFAVYLEKLVKAEIEVVTECNFVDYSLTFCGTFILTCKNNENAQVL